MKNQKPDFTPFGCTLMALSYGLILIGVASFPLCLLPLSRTVHLWAILVSAFGIGGGTVLIKFHNLIFRVPTYTEDDLLSVLNTEWKPALVLQNELSKRKGVGDSIVDAFFREPNLGWIYATLDTFKEMDLVEERTVAREGSAVIRHRTQKEYRLTQGGLRKKDEALLRSRQLGIASALSSQQS